MLENLIVVSILLIAIWLCDWRNFKQAASKARTVYILLLIPSAYLSILFIFHLPWPNIGYITRIAYGWPAKQLLALLT
ncbi:hypothetical protein [Paenibacillus sinopodophylli]|uniref:hypothetical protein n=1 Tax=Paenibacillus sinopodophylli TaxID=1837342 RepID=UPI00110D1E64|nr:hypothetical protein [Paenibacillus sinopodophylli]